MLVTVHVGVSLRRPPRLDRLSQVIVLVDDPRDDLSDLTALEHEAEMIAMAMAVASGSVALGAVRDQVSAVSRQIVELEL